MNENFEQTVIRKRLNGIMPLSEEEIGLLLRYTENELNSAIIRRVVDHCFREVIHLKALIFGLVKLVPEAKTTGENLLFDLRNLYRRRYELEVLYALLKRHPVEPEQYLEFLTDDLRDLDMVAQENEESLVMGAGLCTASVYMDSLFLAREALGEDRWWLPRCGGMNERNEPMNDSDRYIEESLNNAPPLSDREREMVLKYKGANLRPSVTGRIVDCLRLEVDSLGEAMQKFSVLVAREVSIYELSHKLSLLYSQRQEIEVLYALLVRHEAEEEAYLEFLREDIEAIDKLAGVMSDTFKQVEKRSEKGVHIASLVWARKELGEDRWWLPEGE